MLGESRQVAYGCEGGDPKEDDDNKRRKESVPAWTQRFEIIFFIDEPNGRQRSIYRFRSSMLIESKRVELGGHGYYCSVTIPSSALRTALDCLERFARHPDTAALHDPIYALLQDPDSGAEEALVRSISAHTGHPAVAELRAILGGHVEISAPDLAAVLERHGPVRDADDLVSEVDRRLSSYADSERILRAQIDHLEGGLVQAERASNAVAALGAFVLVFGLIGWAIALGVLDVQWMDSPVPSDIDAASSGHGSPLQKDRRESP